MAMEIAIGKGFFALVDDSDYEWLNQWKWRLTNTGYAVRRQWLGRDESGGCHEKLIRMHRLIVAAPPELEVDHIDGNKLNNQRSNLRLATSQQNNFNFPIRKDKRHSRYKGVSRVWDGKKFRSHISINGKTKHLGCFTDEVEAAKAYDAAAVELFGEYARLNFPLLA